MPRTPKFADIVRMACARGCWNGGASVKEIAGVAKVSTSTVRCWLKNTGLTTLTRRKQA